MTDLTGDRQPPDGNAPRHYSAPSKSPMSEYVRGRMWTSTEMGCNIAGSHVAPAPLRNAANSGSKSLAMNRETHLGFEAHRLLLFKLHYGMVPAVFLILLAVGSPARRLRRHPHQNLWCSTLSTAT
jgi:hypothetical protein